MGRPSINMTGQKIFKLTVLYKDVTKTQGTWWICRCDCGNIKSIRGTDLRTGRIKSCGCYNKQINRELHLNDLTNKTFGYLTVIKNLNKTSNNRHNIWLCQCKCGTQIEVPSDRLITGNTQSCGCLHSKGEEKIGQLLNQNNIYFEKEKVFKKCINPKTKGYFRFNFYIPEQNYCIEFDGVQHFISKENSWTTSEKLIENQQRDKYKNDWCLKNNIPLIRIPYTHLQNLCIEDLLLKSSKFLIKEE